MQIALKHTVPAPLAGTFSLHPLWDQEKAMFQDENKYLIRAASGKGKSTLLHLIYGIRKDYSGEIFLDQQPIQSFNSEDWSAIRRTKLSIVFQDLRLFPELTVVENIQLKTRLTGNEYPFHEWAEQLGIQDHLHRKAGILSYGQQQRVAIIRALCQPFEFLLMDEPFSHLDDANIEVACQLIEEQVRNNNAGLILSSLGPNYPLHFDQEVEI